MRKVTRAAVLALMSATGVAHADGDAVKGKGVFVYCGACHRVGPGATTLVGPELNGVVGRKAGSLPDYPYTDAMKESGLTWDEATLTRYLHAPRDLVPKTRMTFAGLKRDADIANLIAYLKTMDAAGNPLAPPP